MLCARGAVSFGGHLVRHGADAGALNDMAFEAAHMRGSLLALEQLEKVAHGKLGHQLHVDVKGGEHVGPTCVIKIVVIAHKRDIIPCSKN